MSDAIYLPYTQTIAAGGVFEASIPGRFFVILSTSGSADPFVLIGHGGQEVQVPAGIAIELPDGDNFTRIRIRNSEGSAVTVRFATSNGKIFDNRNVISGTVITSPVIPDTLATPASIAVPTTAPGAPSVAADTTTKEVHIQNNGANDLWWGDANVDGANNRGQKIAAGGKEIIVTTAAIYLRATTGATTASVATLKKA